MSTLENGIQKEKDEDKVFDNIDKLTTSQLFQEFYSGVTLHGFRFLFEGKDLVRKLIWFVITTSVFVFAVY